MDFQSIAAIAFIALLTITLYVERKKVILQKMLFPFLYAIIYRTTVGLASMERLAKKLPRLLRWAASVGVVVGFLGMALITVELLRNLYKVFFVPGAASGVGVIQPFAKNIPGTFYVPFFYFIISIFILVIVHEFSHGVMARVYNMKVKSSGLAFLGILLPILPAAFVEPDEKQLKKRPAWQQLSVFAAGPFSNIVLAIVAYVVLLFVAQPVIGAILQPQGLVINNFVDGAYPVKESGLAIGDLVVEIDGKETLTFENVSGALDGKKPGETVTVTTNRSSHVVTLGANPASPEKPYLGIYFEPKTAMKESFIARYGEFTGKAVLWVSGLLLWLYILNVGVGLFNLVPLPIVDGGRMMQLALTKVLPAEKAEKTWRLVGTFFAVLILINIIAGFVT